MNEMNELQTKAFNIYINSATIDNNFSAISYSVLADTLISDGEKCSKSAIGRWAKKWQWKDYIKKGIDTTIETSKETYSKSDDVFILNEQMNLIGYNIVIAQMKSYERKIKEGGHLTSTEEKFIIQSLKISTTREDKLLDRRALLASRNLVSSEDVLQALSDTILEVEEPREVEGFDETA